MTTTVPPAGVVLQAAPDSGITRLNPSDGLFLRAEHLEGMQGYTSELALAVGLACGSGVVYGYPVTLTDKVLTVGPGLAIDPSGQPLHSTTSVNLTLPDITSDQCLVVQVTTGDPYLHGTDNVYGNLCDDPSSPATIQPWADEGVIVQVVVPDAFPAGSGAPSLVHRRSWLASRYFAQEHPTATPWLASGADVLRLPWSEPAPQPRPDAVALAALLPLSTSWVLDVWMVRRDIGGPLAKRSWQWRLGLRPWDVFLAQVLQFQQQFADIAATPASSPDDDKRRQLINDALAAYNALTVKPKKLGQALTDLHDVQRLVASPVGPVVLRDHFYDLPPAGFLPKPEKMTDCSDYYQYYGQLFGQDVCFQIFDCSADFALQAVEQAQHLDRIPLAASTTEKPKVDVLVPSQAATGAGYSWAAFVRRPTSDLCENVQRTEAGHGGDAPSTNQGDHSPAPADNADESSKAAAGAASTDDDGSQAPTTTPTGSNPSPPETSPAIVS